MNSAGVVIDQKSVCYAIYRIFVGNGAGMLDQRGQRATRRRRRSSEEHWRRMSNQYRALFCCSKMASFGHGQLGCAEMKPDDPDHSTIAKASRKQPDACQRPRRSVI